MYKIKIMKTPDGKFYWVMYSRNGTVICRSDRHETKLGALYTASLVKRRGVGVDVVSSNRERNANLVNSLRKSYGF